MTSHTRNFFCYFINMRIRKISISKRSCVINKGPYIKKDIKDYQKLFILNKSIEISQLNY